MEIRFCNALFLRQDGDSNDLPELRQPRQSGTGPEHQNILKRMVNVHLYNVAKLYVTNHLASHALKVLMK